MKNNLYRHYHEHLPAKTKTKIDKNKLFRLDLAEGLFMPSPKVCRKLKNIRDKHIASLPDRNCLKLKIAIAKFLKVKPDNVSVFAGSDEAIEVIPRIYLDPGDTALAVTPLFQRLIQTNYKVGAEVCLIITNKENSFNLSSENYEQITKYLKNDAKLAWLCTPNNPTGVIYDKKKVLTLVKNFPDTMFVIDEVYQEYFSLDPIDSYVSYVGKYKNLIVLRSFSKAFGLAGIRVGYAVANSKTVSDIESFRIMYNLSFVSQELALAALSDIKYVKKTTSMANKERKRVTESVSAKNKNIEFAGQSKTSLLLVRHKKGDLFKKLLGKGYITSDWRSSPGIEKKGFVRITVGDTKYNDRVIRILSNI